jgi:hypothetical protein
VQRRLSRMETFDVPLHEIEVKLAARGELVQAMDGTWFELRELEPIWTELVLEDLPEPDIILTGLPDDEVS